MPAAHLDDAAIILLHAPEYAMPFMLTRRPAYTYGAICAACLLAASIR